MNFIYGLYCPSTGLVRYIGKADNVAERFRGHLTSTQSREKSHRASWIRLLLARGEKPTVKTLFGVPAGMKWQHAERFFIASCRSLGFKLTNGTLGGDGLSFINDDDRLLWRENLGVARVKVWKDPEYRASTITKSKAGLARPEVKKKMSAIRKALRNEPQALRRQSVLTERAWANPETREKMSAGIKAAWADPDTREKMRAAMRASLASPEARERKRIASTEMWRRRKLAAQQKTEPA